MASKRSFDTNTRGRTRAAIGSGCVWAVTGALALFATSAKADPCEAPLPSRPGQTFSGRVDWIGDGDSLCVRSGDGSIEVRLADFNAPEKGQPGWRDAKGILRTLAYERWAVCTVTAGRYGRTTSYDRVIAVCRVGGRRLGDAMRARGAPEGGR